MSSSIIYYIIYCTHNTKNNKKYVGSHKTHTLEFDGYLGSGKILNKAILKYGIECFYRETLEIAYTTNKKLSNQEWTDLIHPIETQYIQQFKTMFELYNISNSAFGGPVTSNTRWIHNIDLNKELMIPNTEINYIGYTNGRLPSVNKGGSNTNRKLYSNSVTLEEKYFSNDPGVPWSIGSIHQSTMIRYNHTKGKTWCIEPIKKLYTLADIPPKGFELGMPWSNRSKWKEEKDQWTKV